MPDPATRILYQRLPAMRLLRDRHPTASARARLGFVRLAATHLHCAATLLIDWELAVGGGWPRLQPPSSPLPKTFRRSGARRYAGFPWSSGKWT